VNGHHSASGGYRANMVLLAEDMKVRGIWIGGNAGGES
jgi:N-acetylglucosamine-6-phosphate deacetylase